MFPIRDHNPSYRLPLTTLTIIIFTSWVFLNQITSPDIEAFIRKFALIPQLVNFYDWLTLFPFVFSIFLHGGWFHLLSNMWFLWIFGDNVEAFLGHFKFLFFYLFSGIGAGLFQYLVEPYSSIPVVGASGAIAGVLAAYLVLFPKHKIDTLVFGFGGWITEIQLPASIMLGYWFIIQLFSGVGSLAVVSSRGGIAWWAHIGGFITGWIMVKLVKFLKIEK